MSRTKKIQELRELCDEISHALPVFTVEEMSFVLDCVEEVTANLGVRLPDEAPEDYQGVSVPRATYADMN